MRWEEQFRRKGSPIRSSKIMLFGGLVICLLFIVLPVLISLFSHFFPGDYSPAQTVARMLGGMFLNLLLLAPFSCFGLYLTSFYFNCGITVGKDAFTYQNFRRKSYKVAYDDVLSCVADCGEIFGLPPEGYVDALTLYVKVTAYSTGPYQFTFDEKLTFTMFVGLRELHEQIQRHNKEHIVD